MPCTCAKSREGDVHGSWRGCAADGRTAVLQNCGPQQRGRRMQGTGRTDSEEKGLCTGPCPQGEYPPPLLAGATLKSQNLTEATPLVALTRALFVCAVGKHKR